MSICKLEHIEKKYESGETIYPLKDVNLEMKEGEFAVVEGPSGLGKSTLLFVMGTLLASDAGKLQIDGVDTEGLDDKALTELRAEKIGFIFQESSLIQSLTLRDNLEFVRNAVKGRDRSKVNVDEWLDKLGLSDRADYLPHQLSGGQKRRAMVARALMTSPKLILADEPTNDLDDEWAEKIIELLHEACRGGAAVVMVTHNNRWTEGADAKYELRDGVLNAI